MATPTAITMIATAAMAATMIGVTGRSSLVREPEEARRQVDAHDLELLDELGPDPGRLQPALDLALDDAGLLEDEHILHHDDVTFHPLDLGDVRDLARAVLESALV